MAAELPRAGFFSRSLEGTSGVVLLGVEVDTADWRATSARGPELGRLEPGGGTGVGTGITGEGASVDAAASLRLLCVFEALPAMAGTILFFKS